jgi:drug/metabolite transporter (DMT)-like permease
MDAKKLMAAKIYHISRLTWIFTGGMMCIALFCCIILILLIPQVLGFENKWYMLLMLFGFIFLGSFFAYAAISYIDIPTIRLELSENGVIFYGNGYRIYTPWANISMIRWTRFSPSFPGFIFLKEPAVMTEISFEEGKMSRRAVIEKRHWWMLVGQFTSGTYTQTIRIPTALFLRKDKREGSIQYFRYYVPYLFRDQAEID